MTRATLCADVASVEELDALKAWLRRWRPLLSYVSPNYGDGCCVHVFDVEGPDHALQEIPNSLRAGSDWVTGSRRSGNPMGPSVSELLGE